MQDRHRHRSIQYCKHSFSLVDLAVKRIFVLSNLAGTDLRPTGLWQLYFLPRSAQLEVIYGSQLVQFSLPANVATQVSEAAAGWGARVAAGQQLH